MPDTKLDEAIALAREIESKPRRDFATWENATGAELILARALLDATAPGVQYRAGMEAAAALCDSRAEFGRELERDGATSRDSPNWPVIEAESLARDIRAAIAALPASPEPAPAKRWRHHKRGSVVAEIGRGRLQTSSTIEDMTDIVLYRHESDGTFWARPISEFDDGRFSAEPGNPEPSPVAMPELRWERSMLCAGTLELGYVEEVWLGKRRGTVYRAIVSASDWMNPDFLTESEARIAVEAAVRERLGIVK